MTFDQIKEAWLKAKAGFLNEDDLRYVKSEVFDDRTWLLYECPCGCDDHLAMRAMVAEGYSQYPAGILNCFANDKQWVIRPIDVAGIIKGEEEKYLKLLERAPSIVKKVIAKRGISEETLFFLEDTHGIDRDTVQSILEEINHTKESIKVCEPTPSTACPSSMTKRSNTSTSS